jgi:hypothetical protein
MQNARILINQTPLSEQADPDAGRPFPIQKRNTLSDREAWERTDRKWNRIWGEKIKKRIADAARSQKEKKEFFDKIHGKNNKTFSKRDVDAEVIDMTFTRKGWFEDFVAGIKNPNMTHHLKLQQSCQRTKDFAISAYTTKMTRPK